MSGKTLWFTGLSGAGKSTIAKELVSKLRDMQIPIVLLDGNVVRETLSSDLGYTKEDRDKNITRIAQVCYLVSINDILNIACVISPTKAIREYARKLIGENNFVEIFVRCPIDVCEKRDVWGHYKKFRNGEIQHLVGITVPYEEPDHPDIKIETDTECVEESVEKIVLYLEKNKII
jgi:adenylylsulfate kinase